MKIPIVFIIICMFPFIHYGQGIEFSLNNGIIGSQSNRISGFTNARNNNMAFSYSPSVAISYSADRFNIGLSSGIINVATQLNVDGLAQFEYRNDGYNLTTRSTSIGVFFLSSIINTKVIRIQMGMEFNVLPVSINDYPRVIEDSYTFVSYGTEYSVDFEMNTIQVRNVNYGISSLLNIDYKLSKQFFVGVNLFARFGLQELSSNYVSFTVKPDDFNASGRYKSEYLLVNFGNVFGARIALKYLI